MPRDDELLDDGFDELDRALDPEELDLDRLVALLRVELEERSRLTDELLPDEELPLRTPVEGLEVDRLRSTVEGLALDEGLVRIVDGLVVDGLLLEEVSVRRRSTLLLLPAVPLGTSRAPPIESITRPGTGVSRQFLSADERSVLGDVRDDEGERSVEELGSGRRSRHEGVAGRSRVSVGAGDSSLMIGAGALSAGTGLGRRLSGVTRSVRSGTDSPEF